LIVRNLKSNVALGVAVFILLATTTLIAFLILHVSTDEETWKRYTYLLTGVEAVVFAAVGWLFGKEVHREQAENILAAAEQGSGATRSPRKRRNHKSRSGTGTPDIPWDYGLARRAGEESRISDVRRSASVLTHGRTL
jgi:hypothetical protein